MFGFFIGTACLIGFAALARRGHWRHHHGYGYGHGCHGGGFGRHHGRGFGPRFWLHRVLDRLDTTPGQEKVIREALSDLKEEAWGLRSEFRGTRKDVADAIRAPELDKAQIDRVFEKHDEVIEKLRAAGLRTVEKIHATLDERQRKQLADMIESGPWGMAYC
jgi:Spy/CpxP family protein refolding chaperone